MAGPGNTFPTFLVPGYRSLVTLVSGLHTGAAAGSVACDVMYRRGASVPVLAEFLSSFYNIAALLPLFLSVLNNSTIGHRAYTDNSTCIILCAQVPPAFF